MKLSTRIKRLTQILLAAAAAGVVQSADALNYSPGHLLLVFRDPQVPVPTFNDVVFDLGSVSNYIGLTAGTRVNVTNFNIATVRSNYNNSLSGADFLLVAATASGGDPLPRIWLTDLNLSSIPADLTVSQLSVQRGKIENVGVQATAITASNAAPFII